jgi:hypothetical protein
MTLAESEDMKPPLPRIQTGIPRTLHVQLEIANAMRALFGADQDELLRERRAEVVTLRRDLEALRQDTHKAFAEAAVLAKTELRKYFAARKVLAEVDKAGFRPDQPRWPEGSGEISGRWSGGAGESSPLPPKPPPEELPPRSWIGHNQGPPLDDPPEIPSEEALPPEREDWRFAKDAANWLLRAGVRTAIRVGLEATIGGPVGDFLLAMEAAYWLHRYLPAIRSYLDPPKTWEELQQNRGPGYDEHHVVEQWSENDGIPRSLIDSPDNKVPIPKMKHWQMNGWLDEPNDEFKDADDKTISPRQWTRGKSWEERYQFGLDVLKRFGVLKP